MNTEQKDILSRLLQKWVFLRMTLPILIVLIMLIFLISDMISGYVPLADLFWLVIGGVLGHPFGLFRGVSWKSDVAQVILNSLALVILMLYIALRLNDDYWRGQGFIDLAYVASVLMLLCIGMLIGRSIALRDEISRTLDDLWLRQEAPPHR